MTDQISVTIAESPTLVSFDNGSSITVTAASTTIGVTSVGILGPQGSMGSTGATGPQGPGVPLGGTTGQVLNKASNADNDTAWYTVPSDAAAGTASLRTLGTGATQAMQGSLAAPLASPALSGTPTAPSAAADTNTTQLATTANVVSTAAAKSTLTTKGDIYVATAASTPARLAVGSNNQVLTADSTQSTGAKWATPQPTPNDMNLGLYYGITTIKAATFDPFANNNSSAFSLVDGTIYFCAMWLPSSQSITGMIVPMATQGNFTADNNNKVALYSSDGTTLTLVGASVDNASGIWKQTTGTNATIAFNGGPFTVAAGVVYGAYLYNSSAQVTAPQVPKLAANASMIAIGQVSNKIRVGTMTVQSDMPSPTQVLSGISSASAAGQTMPFMALY